MRMAAVPDYCAILAQKVSPLRGDQRAFRSPFGNLRAPSYKQYRPQTLAGRGGSVSRRDHNQAAGSRAHLTGGTTYAEKPPPNAIRSSGEGVWGRGASLREAASPPACPQRRQVAAALSAAVTITKLIGDAPNSQAEPTKKKGSSRAPAALRERGAGGEALLTEKRPRPQRVPT